MEKILSEIRRILDVGYVNEEDDKELTNLLNTEVQKAVEEAVRGFVEWLFTEDGEAYLLNLDIARYDDMKAFIETYLKELKDE